MPPSDILIQPHMSHSILILSQGPIEKRNYSTGAEIWNDEKGRREVCIGWLCHIQCAVPG